LVILRHLADEDICDDDDDDIEEVRAPEKEIDVISLIDRLTAHDLGVHHSTGGPTADNTQDETKQKYRSTCTGAHPNPSNI